ncbi:MAG: DNA-binding response regulator [Chloroflexi bacterium]|nr:DNA-binding response regulator [Chloroflexota bacterium]MDL1884049.1 response regulator transcription factor [Anaerolineae bacterium CFX8]
MPEIAVLIVGDNPLARMGLVSLLAGQPGLVVVGQAAGGSGLAADIDLYRPDVIVWDMGWSAPERLADARESGVPVVALLADLTQAADARAAGARGFLPGDAAPDALAAAITAAASGLAVMTPGLLETLLPPGDPAAEPPVEALTARERDVLQLLAEGLPNKTIARRLGITDHTVKFHVNAIMGKLNAQSRTDAVVKATRLGLIIL